MSRKSKLRKARKAARAAQARLPLPRHIVVDFGGDFGGDPTAGLDCDCPICALMAASGEEVATFDPRSQQFVRMPPAPRPPTVPITLAADATVAPHLGAAVRELDVPVGFSAGELVEGLRFLVPDLGAAFPQGGLELRVDGERLDPHVEVTGGCFTLVASRAPRGAMA